MNNLEKIYNSIDTSEVNHLSTTEIKTSVQVEINNTIDKIHPEYSNTKKDIEKRQKEKVWRFLYQDILTELYKIEEELIGSSDFVKKSDLINRISKLTDILNKPKLLEKK